MFLDKKIRELEQVLKEVPKETERIVLRNKDKILDFIREKQLYEQGIDGNGNKLLQYKPFTIAFKRQKGQPTDRTTLFDTGGFYKGFDLIYTDQNSIGVFSRDEKAPELLEKYGFSVMQFTAENNKIINEQIIETQLLEWLTKQKVFTQI